MTSVLGVDGGQSGIRLRHSSGERTVEVEGVSRLEGDTVAAVAAAIGQGWRTSGFGTIDRVVLGLSTAPTEAPTRERLCAMVANRTEAAEVWLADDSVTSHAGALSMGWGVSVVVGTGAACLAVPEQGGAHIIGGHGYLLGDEGSAYWIGREGLRAVLRHEDGRGPGTALAEAATYRFKGLDDLGDRLHTALRPVNDIAQFALDVLAIADAGDPLADALVEDATGELVLLVSAGMAAVRAGDGDVPVALGGRLLASRLLGEANPLRARLDRRLQAELPRAVTRTADGSPLDGAMALGSSSGPGPYSELVYTWRRPVAA